MARRGLIPNDVAAARETAMRQLRTLLTRFDVAEATAQMHAADMVLVLVDFAKDVTKPDSFRKECALDVLSRAYGTPAQKGQALTTIDPASKEGNQIAAAIEIQRQTADQLQQLDAYIGKVPVSEWPPYIKELAGDLVSAWETEDVVSAVLAQAPAG